MAKWRNRFLTRFQFSLRTAILVVSMVALAIAWWIDHQRLSERLRKEKSRVQFLETSRMFDAPSSPR